MMLVKEFSDTYGVSTASVYTHKCLYSPEWIIEQGTTCIVDEKYLLKIQDYRRKLWLCAHDYYYYFTYVLEVSQFKIAEIISEYFDESHRSWNMYLHKDLFQNIEKSLVDIKISTKLSKFIEFAEISIGLVHNKKRNNKEYLKRLKDMK